MIAKCQLTLQDLLEVEDDPSLLDFSCRETNVLLWPHIRAVFFRLMLSDLLYGAPLVSMSGGGEATWKAALTLGRAMLHNAWSRVSRQSSGAICLVTDGVGNQLIDGKCFNRLSDHFALCAPSQTLVIEDHHRWKWPFPRHFGRVIFHAPLQARNTLNGRFLVRDRHRRYAERLVRLVGQRARTLLNWELGAQRAQQLTEMLARKLAAQPYQYFGYIAMLERIAPKVLMVNAACYGPSASLIAAAREMNVVTAECQHGAISSGHDAYNVAPCLYQSDQYRKTLPDFFLGYGNWWNEQINVPVTKLAIGNPHRDAQLKQIPLQTGLRQDVLILGDGIETERYLTLSAQLAAVLSKRDLRVVFRPHPIERHVVDAEYKNGISGVHIDKNPAIYQSLISAHAVVSEVSTGLFEAIGLAEKIFIWDTPKSRFGYPVHPFQSFCSAFELADLLDQGVPGRLAADDISNIWAPGWQENYLKFLQANGVTSNH